MTTEEENENTKRGGGRRVCFPIPLSSRLTTGYKHVSSSGGCDNIHWRKRYGLKSTESNATAGIRRSPEWWHPRHRAPPPPDRNGHHQTAIPSQTFVRSCIHNVCKALAGLGVCSYDNSTLYQLLKLRYSSNPKTASSVTFTLIFGNRIHWKWKKHDEIPHACLVTWPRSDPVLPKFKARNTSEKSGTRNMSRLDTKTTCFTQCPSM